MFLSAAVTPSHISLPSFFKPFLKANPILSIRASPNPTCLSFIFPSVATYLFDFFINSSLKVVDVFSPNSLQDLFNLSSSNVTPDAAPSNRLLKSEKSPVRDPVKTSLSAPARNAAILIITGITFCAAPITKYRTSL